MEDINKITIKEEFTDDDDEEAVADIKRELEDVLSPISYIDTNAHNINQKEDQVKVKIEPEDDDEKHSSVEISTDQFKNSGVGVEDVNVLPDSSPLVHGDAFSTLIKLEYSNEIPQNSAKDQPVDMKKGYSDRTIAARDNGLTEMSTFNKSNFENSVVSYDSKTESTKQVPDVDGKSFSRASDGLKKVKCMHGGVKCHQCDVCGRCLTTASNLNKHKLLHSGLKPHQCGICKKCFTRSSDLNRHKLIHKDVKPYKCDLCQKAFSRLDALNQHKLQHSGENPHKCDVCGRCLTTSSNLNKHKLIHSGAKPHKCHVCQKGFS